MANGLPSWDCGTQKCDREPVDGLVLCWNECPLNPTQSYPVVAPTVIEYGQPLKLNGVNVEPLLAADAANLLIGFAYGSADRSATSVFACNDICVVVRESKLRMSQIKFPVGYTAAQKDALVAQALTLNIGVNKLA
jgi:hypothetical protein